MTAYYFGSATEGSPGRGGRIRAANRAMTQAEMSAQFFAGVAEADRSASQISRLSSNWRNGVSPDGYTTFGSPSITGFAATSAGTGTQLVYPTNALSFEIGKRYKFTFDITINSGAVSSVRFRQFPASGTTMGPNITNITASGTYEIEFVATLTSAYPIFRNDSTAVDFVVTNASFVQLGNTINLSPAGIQLAPGQWLDHGGNKAHVHIPDGCRLLNPETVGDLRGTNTWSASDTLQYFNGLNANIFASNAYVNNMIVVPTVSYAGGFNIGDGVNETYYAEIAGPVAANIPIEVGLKTSVNDGTNRKLTIKPTAAYTGSVRTTVFCGSVEV